jgi:hypothetical protein
VYKIRAEFIDVGCGEVCPDDFLEEH